MTSSLNPITPLETKKGNNIRNYIYPIVVLILMLGIFASGFVLQKRSENKSNEKEVLGSQISPAVFTNWPQYQHDAQHTGRTTVEVAPNASQPYYKLRWAKMSSTTVVQGQFVTPSPTPPGTTFQNGVNKSITDGLTNFSPDIMYSNLAQPIVNNVTISSVNTGVIFIGALNGKFYAINALTGATIWSYQTGGPIIASGAYESGVVLTASMDGKLYGLDPATGAKNWEYDTGAPISTSPTVLSGYAYIGSRNGKFYAINVSTGLTRWTPFTANVASSDTATYFNASPIVSPAAITTNGSTVFFASENMYFYALNTSTGALAWSNPQKMYGQSTVFTVPVVNLTQVMAFTQSSQLGAENDSTGIESVFKAMRPRVYPTYPTPTAPTPTSPPGPVCPNGYNLINGSFCEQTGYTADQTAETTAVRNWLNGQTAAGVSATFNSNLRQQTFHVFNTSTGAYPFANVVALGRVTGNNAAPFPPIITDFGPTMYWRSVYSTLLNDVPTFGSLYCPDISGMNTTTGERVPIQKTGTNGFCPELDNGFFLTMGGNRLYMQNGFRGVETINMNYDSVQTTKVLGTEHRITASLAYQDGGNFRGYSPSVIYYGNDSQQSNDIRPNAPYSSTYWDSGAVPVDINGTRLLIVNETGEGGAGETLKFNAGLVAIQGN